MRISSFVAFILITTSIAGSSIACDLCSCHIPQSHASRETTTPFYLGFSEQFTHYGTLAYNGDELDNPTGQHLDSSITQLVLGVSFLDEGLSIQANVPYIYRSYSRPEGEGIEHGDESGFGDISLIARWRVVDLAGPGKSDLGLFPDSVQACSTEPEWNCSFAFLAGLKLPTGDASRLSEEFAEGHDHGDEGEHSHDEAAPESGIHGHDLALGTGSYDLIVGAQFLSAYRAFFFQAETQFTLRGDGRYSYHFANDLTWSGGPGVYLLRNAGRTFGLQCVVSGESKDTDRFQGKVAEDTGLTSLFIGPKALLHTGSLSAEAGVEIPVIRNATKLQIVPDYRIRASITWSF